MLQGSDLVIWLRSALDQRQDEWRPADTNMIEVVNKCDLTSCDGSGLPISAKNGLGIKQLLLEIKELARNSDGLQGSVLLSRFRDQQAISDGLSALEAALAALGNKGAKDRLELIAEDLRSAIFPLQRLLGTIDPESVLDELFAGFCIGK